MVRSTYTLFSNEQRQFSQEAVHVTTIAFCVHHSHALKKHSHVLKVIMNQCTGQTLLKFIAGSLKRNSKQAT